MGILVEMARARLLDQFKDDAIGWVAFLTVLAESLEDLITCLVSLSTQTWKDTAEGVWLDRAGEIVGCGRPGEEIDNALFTVCDVGETGWDVEDPAHGWSAILTPSYGGYVWDLYGLSTGVQANDETFLFFINAKIAATNADASLPGLAKYCSDAFGLSVTVERTSPGHVTITLPATGYTITQRRFLEMFCPAMAGIEVYFDGWPEV
jgi:hypothetical protein